MSFKYEHIRHDEGKGVRESFVIHFSYQERELTVTTEDLIWAAMWLPPKATAEWLETTDDTEFLDHIKWFDKGRGIIILALAQYLRSIEEARITKDPQLVRDVNRITSWIESYTQPHRRTLSRKISEEILDMETLEAAIKKEIEETMAPKLAIAEILQCSLEEVYDRDPLVNEFLPDEYARQRRLGFKPYQIDYDSTSIPFSRRRRRLNKTTPFVSEVE